MRQLLGHSPKPGQTASACSREEGLQLEAAVLVGDELQRRSLQVPFETGLDLWVGVFVSLAETPNIGASFVQRFGSPRMIELMRDFVSSYDEYKKSIGQ